MLAGMGEHDKITPETYRQTLGTALRHADKLALKSAAVFTAEVPKTISPEKLAQSITEGALAGRYNYREFLKPEKRTTDNFQLTIIPPTEKLSAAFRKGGKLGTILANAQNRVREITNRPGNEVNPAALAVQARKLARKYNFKCTVFNENQLKKMGMNTILAVGSGSANRPCLIMLEYAGTKKKNIDVALVGKAVTFDSGGLDLKLPNLMDTMKFDKAGGCSILGIITAAAELKLPLKLIGLIPAVENMPSHQSYRPDDIIKTYSGQTVEIKNTDAEGRLILCDALSYAAKMKPDAIIDMATLTGACVVALGRHRSGLFSNNDRLIEQIQTAAQISGENVWHLPSGPEYLEDMKGTVSDLVNAAGRAGGSCIAAAFLGSFVENIPWAHIDVAATADTTKEKPYRAAGATGIPVKMVLEHLRNLK